MQGDWANGGLRAPDNGNLQGCEAGNRCDRDRSAPDRCTGGCGKADATERPCRPGRHAGRQGTPLPRKFHCRRDGAATGRFQPVRTRANGTAHRRRSAEPVRYRLRRLRRTAAAARPGSRHLLRNRLERQGPDHTALGGQPPTGHGHRPDRIDHAAADFSDRPRIPGLPATRADGCARRAGTRNRRAGESRGDRR